MLTQSLTSVIELVQRSVTARTGRRVKNLTVEVADDAVVLRGRATSFHVKQLALLGVRAILPEARLLNEIVVV